MECDDVNHVTSARLLTNELQSKVAHTYNVYSMYQLPPSAYSPQVSPSPSAGGGMPKPSIFPPPDPPTHTKPQMDPSWRPSGVHTPSGRPPRPPRLRPRHV